ncbi:MAG: hypothetical protein U5J82_02820 [Desulfobacterales bacterium]|nr:hypothetical protein [Desulfobacterales bacterium]
MRSDLDSPSGMAWRDGKLYVANHDEVLEFNYELGTTTLAGDPTKLMDLPAAGNHCTRNLVLNDDGTLLYVAVGSASNIGEYGMEIEQGRAAIHELDLLLGPVAALRRRPAHLRTGSNWNPGPESCGPRSTNATCSAPTWCPIT